MFLLLLLVSVTSAEECLMACQRDYRPICGTDGQTYSNQCQLDAFNCMMKTAVVAAYQGECVDLRELGCNIACTMQWEPVCGTNAVTYGNLCQLESDACLKKTAIAVAHKGECADLRESECNIACTMQWEPVCGTNAVTYGNLCQLKSDACLKRTNVAVQYAGECVATAAAECNVACTMQYQPVCGTNAVTYGNLCQLEADACMTKTSIAVQHQGVCVERAAECNVACTLQYQPVCGTNQVTYSNLCQMESAACLKKTNIAVQYAGECVEPVAECNVACTMQNQPVCGTNAVTYGNLCQLEADACMKKTNIAVQYAGECVELMSECNTACTLQWQPVCGTNAVTYGNLCQLESDACLKKTKIAVQYAGSCIEPVAECNVACTMQNQPVCGTNAVTYGNLCQLEADACLKKTNVAVQYAGECVEPTTACNVACTLQWQPVCGTDAVTYGNLCMLESEACLKKSALTVARMGSC